MSRPLLTHPLETMCDLASRRPSVSVTLPWPPSLNGLFCDGKHRRTKSKRYEQWLAVAASELRQQSPAPCFGSCRVRFFLSPPDARARDADNYLKAPMDLLVSAGVLQGDSNRYVRGLTAEWSDETPAKPGSVRICVEPAGSAT